MFRPHPGAQAKYFSVRAEIVLAGGGAGGGKTMCLLMDALQGLTHPGYEAAMFRKTLVQHRMSGGLRAESVKYYPRAGGKFNKSELLWEFDRACSVKFYGCDDPSKYDGLQCAFLAIDQLEQLTSEEFWHLQSRVRTASGAPTRIRATCNPEPGWLERFLKSGGYVGADGFPVAEMDGVVRWFVRNQETDEVIWRDSAEDFGTLDADGVVTDGPYADLMPTSFSFVRFPLDANPSVSKKYRAKLQNMALEERRKKLYGNWNRWSGGGLMYRQEWWGWNEGQFTGHRSVLRGLPDEELHFVLAADIGWSTSGDWTAITLMGQGMSGWYLLDMCKFRARESITFEALRRCAECAFVVCGRRVAVALPRDPGKAGLDQEGWQLELGRLGYECHLVPDDGKGGDKIARHRFLSPQAERGHLFIVLEWRPLAAVSEWLVTQQSEPGKYVECTTLQEWAPEMVQSLHSLAEGCPHEVTDVTDSVARGHRFLTGEDPVSASQLAASMTPSGQWAQRGDPRAPVARAVMSEWARSRPAASGTSAPQLPDFMRRGRRIG